MALITNNKLKEEIKKFNKKFLNYYLERNKYNIKKYKYREVANTLPYLAFVINRVYKVGDKSIVEIFNTTQITDTFYNFFFSETTQREFNDIAKREFKTDDFKNSLLNLFNDISKKISDLLFKELDVISSTIDKSVLTNMICLTMSYFYTDDIIGDFGPDIDALLSDEIEYNRNVELFTLKLEYFKQLQEIIMVADPHTFNYLICGINMISKDHNGK